MNKARRILNELEFADISPGKGKWLVSTDKTVKKSKSPNRDLTDQLYDLIASTYSSIGGHVDFKKADDLPADHDVWKFLDFDDDPEPDVIVFGKDKGKNLKRTGSATDGSKAAKQILLQTTVSDLKKKGNFGEVSGPIAHVLLTRFKGVPYVSDPERVKKLLGKDVDWVGEHPNGKYPGVEGWYYRSLGGAKHIKIMVGSPI